jgi:hypothetical protein
VRGGGVIRTKGLMSKTALIPACSTSAHYCAVWRGAWGHRTAAMQEQCVLNKHITPCLPPCPAQSQGPSDSHA